MQDDILRQNIQDGNDALRLIENETFQAAREAVKAHLMQQWYMTKPSQKEDREYLWAMMKALDLVCDCLQETVDTGKLAAVEIEQLQMDTTERD